MNIRSGQGEEAFTERLDITLSRMHRDNILAGFAKKAVPLLVERGKDDLLPSIADHLDKNPTAKASLSGSVKNMMASVKILTEKKAPDLIFKAPVSTQTGLVNQAITIETGKLEADHTILLFYQGECPLCEDTLIDLANKYKQLKEQKHQGDRHQCRQDRTGV